MDKYTPRLLEMGLKGIMGKGGRGPLVREELAKHTAVYMAALGGGGALAALKVKSQRVIAFEDFGPEAIRTMGLDDFPVWVVSDCTGRDYYAEVSAPWRQNELLPQELRLPVET